LGPQQHRPNRAGLNAGPGRKGKGTAVRATTDARGKKKKSGAKGDPASARKSWHFCLFSKFMDERKARKSRKDTGKNDGLKISLIHDRLARAGFWIWKKNATELTGDFQEGARHGKTGNEGSK